MALKFKPTTLLSTVGLHRVRCQALLHVSSLSLVNLLHLSILVANDAHILLGDSCLLAELLLEGQSLVHVVLACLSFGLLRRQGGRADLFTHSKVLLTYLL